VPRPSAAGVSARRAIAEGSFGERENRSRRLVILAARGASEGGGGAESELSRAVALGHCHRAPVARFAAATLRRATSTEPGRGLRLAAARAPAARLRARAAGVGRNPSRFAMILTTYVFNDLLGG
jgi:hypothetical protein